MNLSFRISVNSFEKEEPFGQLLDFLTPYKESIDEIALFTEYWHHGYYPLDAYGRLCGIMEDRLNRLRDFGFGSVGINILDTLGHLPEAWDWLPKLPYQGATAPDGKISTSSFCPNSAEYRAYIFRKYTLTAQAKPDFIWVDDDIRMHSLGVPFACFCPECLRLYNDKNHTAHNREQLVALLNSADGGAVRESWVRMNVWTIERLMTLIADAVHGVDSGIQLGLMTLGLGLTTYAGSDFDKWFTALEAVKARPGHGFYEDKQPFAFVRKLHEVNRQIAHYPDSVHDIQYELENFPFQPLAKSVRITLLECTASIASGTNGVAFDALKQEEGTLEEYRPLLRGIQEIRPLWQAMERIAGKYKNAGLYPALSASFEAKRSVNNGNWFEMPDGDNSLQSYILSEIGIPLTMQGEAASSGTILSGNLAEGYTTEELKEMLSRGVMLDGRALEVLTRKGLGQYCGVEVEKTYDNGTYESLTEDPLNGGFGGERRDARQAIFKSRAYVLKSPGEDVRVLSRLTSYTKKDLGPTVTAYENELGGRVVVLGYAPWLNIHSPVKRKQLLLIGDWLSFGRLPVVIDRCLKVVPFVRHATDGSGWFVMLLNGSFDETGAFAAKIRPPAAGIGTVYELLADGSSAALPESAYSRSDEEIVLSLDNLDIWKYRMFYQA